MQYSYLDVNDGTVLIGNTRFHTIWLRENCLCEMCRDKYSMQKRNNLLNIEVPIKINSIETNGDILKIVWKETKNHTSIYPINYLMEMQYEDANLNANKWDINLGEPNYWKNSSLEKTKITKFNIEECNELEWIKQLYIYGFVVLTASSRSYLINYLEKISPIYETEYGKIHFSKALPSTDIPDISLSTEPLDMHADSTFRVTPPLVQFLYCVKNDATGGESIVVDAFKVAKDIRSEDLEVFNILSTVSVDFLQLNTKKKYLFSRRTPLIKLDNQKNIVEVFCSNKNISWSLPYNNMEHFYKAYKYFISKLESDYYQHYFRLLEGECLLTQNYRVFHGRRGFSLHSGQRHLDVWYMPWDYLAARVRYQQYRSRYEFFIGKCQDIDRVPQDAIIPS